MSDTRPYWLELTRTWYVQVEACTAGEALHFLYEHAAVHDLGVPDAVSVGLLARPVLPTQTIEPTPEWGEHLVLDLVRLDERARAEYLAKHAGGD